MKKEKILLLEGIHKNAIKYFEKHDYKNIEYLKKSLSEKELIEKIKDISILGIRSKTQITKNILEKAPKLSAIGCFCIGTNQVDLDTARKQAIPVFNAPFSNTRSVAEMVIAESIMLMRRITEKSNLAHKGEWEKSPKNSYEVRGKNLGIVGYGRIGSQVSILAEALGMNVYYYDIEKKLSYGNTRSLDSLEDLLAISDIVTLHVPATPMTKNMIGKNELKLMRKGSYFINASRGNVVDIPALTSALKSEHLLGAAIDVFPQEPGSNGEKFISELQGISNVILTPHIGSGTQEAQKNIALETAEKLINYCDHGNTIGAVNFVEVNLPTNTKQRLLHIHKNLPGVLKNINYVFSSQKINISGQHLKTDADIGYVIIDIDGKINQETLEKLQNVPNTIKAKILEN